MKFEVLVKENFNQLTKPILELCDDSYIDDENTNCHLKVNSKTDYSFL